MASAGLERWIAAQRPWQAVPAGWTVPGELQGWRFRVEPAPGGVRVVRGRAGGVGRAGALTSAALVPSVR